MSDTQATVTITATQGRPRDHWRVRRRVIVLTLLYCAGMVAYLAIVAADTALHQQIALGLIGLAATVIGSYVFGAVWDDHNIRKAGEA